MGVPTIARAASQARQYIDACRRNDVAAARRARHNCVDVYKWCNAATWHRLIAREGVADRYADVASRLAGQPVECIARTDGSYLIVCAFGIDHMLAQEIFAATGAAKIEFIDAYVFRFDTGAQS